MATHRLEGADGQLKQHVNQELTASEFADIQRVFLSRIEASVARLQLIINAPIRNLSCLTDPDPTTGEQWNMLHILSHMSEFLAYWLAQVQPIALKHTMNLGDQPAPFGRTINNQRRLNAIRASQLGHPDVFFAGIGVGIQNLADFISVVLTVDGANRLGVHQTLDVMSVTNIIEEFLVGHLEEHLDQLEQIMKRSGNPIQHVLE